MTEKGEQLKDGILKRQYLPEPLYLVWSPDDKSVLLGMNVVVEKVRARGRILVRVSWYDSAKNRVMQAAAFRKGKTFWAFRRPKYNGGGEYYFVPLTYELYDKRVRSHVVGGELVADETSMRELLLNVPAV